MNERRKLIIPRDEWLHGEGEAKSALYRGGDGKLCCLGHAGEQLCGIERCRMLAIPAPNSNTEIALAFKEHLPWLFFGGNALSHSGACGELMECNDEQERGIYVNEDDPTWDGNYPDPVPVTDAEREAFITKTFARHDIDVVFVDSRDGAVPGEGSCPAAA